MLSQGFRSVRPWSKQPDDAALIEGSWSEPERFALLYDRHAARIHRYLAQRLGTDTADDLMADTFLVAFRKRRHYDIGRASALPWLYGIATNLIARHKAKEVKQYRLLARTYEGDQSEPIDEAVLERVTAQSLHGPLAGALADLPARLRDVVLLVAWADLSYEEVADALNIPLGTVRSRLSRARGRLRQALGGSDPSEASEEYDR